MKITLRKVSFLQAAWVWICIAAMLAACAGNSSVQPTPPAGGITIISPSFQEGQSIPAKFTCSGLNISPALAWSGLPAGAKSLALVVEDPNAPGGTFDHWVLYNLPAALDGLPEGTASLGSGGKNSFGSLIYGGPCPPAGKPHHYFFTLIAVDLQPDLPGGLEKAGLLNSLQGHILASGRLTGLYTR